MQELDFSIETANADRSRKNLQSPRSRVRGRVKASPPVQHHLKAFPALCLPLSVKLQARGAVELTCHVFLPIVASTASL